MSLFVLVTESPEVAERITHATEGHLLELSHGPIPADPPALFARLEDPTPPKVVVIDSRPDPQTALQLASQLDELCPGVSVVFVSDEPADIGLAAMRAGVRDILQPDSDLAEMRMVLDRALQVAIDRAVVPELSTGDSNGQVGPPTGRVIAVVSPKGGVGKTTVSTNLAVGIAQALPGSTVLVDLDVQFGDVGSALNLEPEHTLPDAVHGPATRDAMVLKTFLTQHITGLYVICAPKLPAEADHITGDDISHLLAMLAAEFGYVVVDTAPGLSEHGLAAIDQATDLVLVTSMDVPGIRGMRKELDTLTDLGLGSVARHLVLNMEDRGAGLTLADVEATLGTDINVVIPRSKAAIAAVNQGIPLMQSGVRDPMTKQLRRLVDRFLPVPAAASKGAGRWTARTSDKPDENLPRPRRAKPGWYPGVRVGAR